MSEDLFEGDFSYAMFTGGEYNPDRDPEPGHWLERDQGEAMMSVMAYHLESEDDVVPEDALPLHATIHTVVETQLAADDPVESRKALARLTGEGLARHEAIHAIGSVIAEEILRVLHEGATPDVAEMNRRLSTLTVESWRANTEKI